MTIIPFQQPLRPVVPTVTGNVDYQKLQAQLTSIDDILIRSGLERAFIQKSVDYYEESSKADGVKLKNWQIKRRQESSILALRCMILKSLLGETCRGMSIQLAHSPLYQWFCGIGRIGTIKVPGKSHIQDFIDFLPQEELKELITKLLTPESSLELATELDLGKVWFDSTCVKANIHFPVDWVLLRDATRTLMKSVIIIRQHGLKVRMSSPSKIGRAHV